MKTLTLTVSLLLIGSLSLASAATIDEQITAIVNASPQERVELINAFKTEVAAMNEQERAAAIAQLRSSMQTNGAMMQREAQTRTQTETKTHMQERLEQPQNGSTQTQMMQQHQAAGQAIHQNTPASTTGSTMGTHQGFHGGR